MTGASITIALKGKDEEARFLEIFAKALEQASNRLFTLWESERAVEARANHPRYREVLRKGGEELAASFESYRGQQVRPPSGNPVRS